MAQPDGEPHDATNINTHSNLLFQSSRAETLALDQLQWTRCARGHYNPLAPIRQNRSCGDIVAVGTLVQPTQTTGVYQHKHPSREHAGAQCGYEHIGLWRVLVGPVEAVSLAKPANPVHEE